MQKGFKCSVCAKKRPVSGTCPECLKVRRDATAAHKGEDERTEVEEIAEREQRFRSMVRFHTQHTRGR